MVSCFFFHCLRFRLEEDIGSRVANGKRQAQMFNERSARFSLYEDTRDTPSPSTRDKYIRDRDGTFLDLLMSEIPGMPLELYKTPGGISRFCRPTIDGSESLLYVMKLKEALESLCIIFGWSLHK